MIQRRKKTEPSKTYDIDNKAFLDGVNGTIEVIKQIMRDCLEQATQVCKEETEKEGKLQNASNEAMEKTVKLFRNMLESVDEQLFHGLQISTKRFIPIPIPVAEGNIKEESLKTGIDNTIGFAIQYFRNWKTMIRGQSKLDAAVIREHIALIVRALEQTTVSITTVPSSDIDKTIFVVRDLGGEEEK